MQVRSECGGELTLNMELSGSGKSPNASLSFRYNANNEALEELYHMCDDDPPTPQNDPPISQTENASPKKADKSSSILDKYFKSMRAEKPPEKEDEPKSEIKPVEEPKVVPPKEVTSSPMKEYLNRLGKRSTTSEGCIDAREGSNETWKIFHDFKFKIAQAVEDIKTRSVDETKEKSVPRENSISDSEENSAIKDSDQQSVGDTDNQVSSLHSSIQNLSEITQPVTAKPTDRESSLPFEKNNSESSDDTHKNLASESENGTGDLLDDSSMLEVESGVEALEDTNIDGLGDINLFKDSTGEKNPPILNILPCTVQRPFTPTNMGLPPSKTNLQKEEPRNYFLNISMYILTFLLIISYFIFPNSDIWNGFLLGIWAFTFGSNLKQWWLDTYFSTDKEPRASFFQLKRNSTMPYIYNIPNVKEHRPIKKFEGWINHYRFHEYDAYTYHINKTTTAFMKLEGCNLRISYTTTKIAKRALWDEKIDKVVFYQHRLYNLTGAKVFLLPTGLVSKRQWSKKYPICIMLNENETIQVLEKENIPEKKSGEAADSKKKEQESEATETNASPEKKKKFVWRKKEKSLSQEADSPGREGLRHRLVRKMHRDKKPDIVSTATEPESQTEKALQEELNEEPDLTSISGVSAKDDATEEDLDETEISRLKEFLDETEPETVEGAAESEWSLHVKSSKDKHSRLFLFGRTGREKLEWFRRIHTAITEASPSLESSVAEDKSSSEIAPDAKEGIEMAVYKVSEKDTVSFPKPNVKANPLPSEIPTIASDWSSYEKTFWPYLLKIMESHEWNTKQTVDMAVTCDLEPTPVETKGKTKKKRKSDPKSAPSTCDCRLLPAEVSWVNTVMARVMYDVMRDPHIMTRVQNRIQRKLNTLKLPSFMSPLVVTELSLSGACPLVERVGAVSWDERGVWLDADLRYDGGAFITILTNINLMKLKEKNLTLEEKLLLTEEHVVETDIISPSMFTEKQLRKRKPAIFDSEVEDSAESSSDDESPPVQPVDSNEALPTPEITTAATESGSSKKKFLRMVDKISTNKYFQQVTDFKYVKRAMEGLSNTDIKLQVEIQGLEGRLALNLPPPPHDRIWLGFRTNPQLVLKARPAVGARTLRFAHISNWIEHKLSKEFEKVLVLPNMEDIAVDLMTPTPVFAD